MSTPCHFDSHLISSHWMWGREPRAGNARLEVTDAVNSRGRDGKGPSKDEHAWLWGMTTRWGSVCCHVPLGLHHLGAAVGRALVWEWQGKPSSGKKREA